MKLEWKRSPGSVHTTSGVLVLRNGREWSFEIEVRKTKTARVDVTTYWRAKFFTETEVFTREGYADVISTGKHAASEWVNSQIALLSEVRRRVAMARGEPRFTLHAVAYKRAPSGVKAS